MIPGMQPLCQGQRTLGDRYRLLKLSRIGELLDLGAERRKIIGIGAIAAWERIGSVRRG